MSDGDWNAEFTRCLGVRLAGDLINDETERGEPIVGDTLLLLLNGHWEPIDFKLPEPSQRHRWELLVDTAEPDLGSSSLHGGEKYH
jgi:glycogen operon protein